MDYPLKTAEQLRQQLRSLRKARGLTQADLGSMIGVSQARVVEIEANPGAVSMQQILQVLQAMGVGLVIRDAQADAAAEALPREPHPAVAATGIEAKKGSW